MGAWVLAGFPRAESMAAAAVALRREGFDPECFTPHPSELAYAVVPGRSSMSRFVLGGGLSGLVFGFVIQWWANAFNWPLNVGGRPAFSVPTYVPICFECMVLFGAFAGLYGFLISLRLPRLHHELQRSALFERHSVDRFLVSIRWELATPPDSLLDRLRALGAAELDEVRDP
jgi:hypothetical protein